MANAHTFDPERFERQSFELVRRGFEPSAVQRELQRAATVVRDLQRQVDSLDGELQAIQSAHTEPLEARRVAEALGAEATKVLDAAHAAAAERAERAEREAEAVRSEAIAAAEALRSEAVAAADAIRAEVDVERQRLLDEAAREAEAAAEDGRRRGRDMVNEAQVVRERMLGDLARKRQTGRAQVEQLRAGRDRLLESLSIAQASLDTAMKDLVESVPEARSAAERAGIRVANEATPTAEVMEAEIESARLVGHPLVEGVPEPGLDHESAPPDPTFITAEMEALTFVDAALEAEIESGAEPDPKVSDSDGIDDGETVEADADADDAQVAVTSEADSSALFNQDEAAVVGAEVVETVDDDGDEAETASGEDVDDGGVDQSESADADSGAVDSADADSGAATPADSIFARLREKQASDDGPDAVTDADRVPPPEPEISPEPESKPEAVADIADDADDADDAEAHEDEGSVVVDPDAEVLKRAVSTALRAVKKVLVEEQGTLLDGIRQSGGDAISMVVEDEDGHAKPYESATEPALVALAEALGGTGDTSTLEVGFAQIRAVALAPVRRRLLEVCEVSSDADELSDTVRGLYRETRSRRLPNAVAAAVAAVRGAIAISTASGDVRWEIDPAGPCGPDCADNALAGPIAAGSPFPTGALHPPTDPNCTCRLVAV
jgi:hypothetical protein